ncbi:SRPBCC family protein [Mycolicibacterium litorale]|uniref:MxaD family protein n=1 Tax=Mycolicibacterium litorale TaxID=758802 RepID=A0AAD1MSY7_9MYCO|nr:SRPBCC family protein [Mycolicibacterium litorale]MCV7416469.1 SRPBCC family protein [Mycolicibacterium litorale]TDY09723.1 polyketide cyclase/dehydrase/lipid transport protein [Mycolicibacterium litorale]BBY17669.1 MxaD family protein [Mycolicibacterium litorale]
MVAQISRRRTISADPQTVWDVLADFGSIHDWLPGVDHSCVLSTDPDGPVGTKRRVQMGRMTLVETITEFDAPTALAYDIAGLPGWLRRFNNRWTVRAAGAGTTVTVTSTVDLGPGRLRALAARLVCLAMAKSSDTMLAGLAARWETAHV